MKKIVFGLLAIVALLAFSSEAYSNADGDKSQEQGVDKTLITKSNKKSKR